MARSTLPAPWPEDGGNCRKGAHNVVTTGSGSVGLGQSVKPTVYTLILCTPRHVVARHDLVDADKASRRAVDVRPRAGSRKMPAVSHPARIAGIRVLELKAVDANRAPRGYPAANSALLIRIRSTSTVHPRVPHAANAAVQHGRDEIRIVFPPRPPSWIAPSSPLATRRRMVLGDTSNCGRDLVGGEDVGGRGLGFRWRASRATSVRRAGCAYLVDV